MEFFIIPLAAMLACGLTLFSGFGLGTLLMPVMALFFPLEVAIALTALIHFLNNLFKLVLFYKESDWKVVGIFGIPALVSAIGGAFILLWLGQMPVIFEFEFLGLRQIRALNLIIGGLIGVFAIFDLKPSLSRWKVPSKFLFFGGILSGFFGGLSGHQGAFRSTFLLKYGLNKEAFIATGVVIACLVDVSRLAVYASSFPNYIGEHGFLLMIVTAAAFVGTLIGKKLLGKTTIDAIHRLVGGMMLGVSILIVLGFI